jgi:Transmembrane secretion effector
MLAPLRERDFALMWAGMTLSFLGDGVYLVAIAWQVYSLSNTPTALSVVGLAWVLPQLPLFLAGGVVADRFERRRVLILADVVRVVAVGLIGALAVTGALQLWHVLVLVVLLGAGDALFAPAFSAIVPELVVDDLLVQANALDSFVRTTTSRLIGPALGGVVVAALGAGEAVLFDAATFAASAAALLAMRARPIVHTEDAAWSSREQLREGFDYVRAQPWIWGTLVISGLGILTTFGPFQVLLPFLVKNHLGGTAGDLGLVFAAGGCGSLVGALAAGQLGLGRRPIVVMVLAWSAIGVELACLGLVSAVWQAAAVVLVGNALAAPGMIVWVALLQTHVPSGLLGRVSSLDWLVSSSLLPLSFALTGPLAKLVGSQTLMIVGGLFASATTLALLALPGVRDIERAAQ